MPLFLCLYYVFCDKMKICKKKGEIIMLKKICILITAFISLFVFNISDCNASSAKEPILGVARTQWEHDLAELKSYRFQDDFLDKIKDEQQYLKSRRGSEHFELLNGKQLTPREKRKNNPLLQMKQKRTKAKFLTDLDLEHEDYIRLVNYLPALKEYYSDNHIAQILPYIALCMNYNIDYAEISYYVKQAIKKETPVEVFKQRLYTVVENKK